MKKYFVILITVSGFFLFASSFAGDERPGAVELGQQLFADPILSKDGRISCASCHIPGFAFADTARVSTGVFGRKGSRNSPSAMNLLSRRPFFWDGRASTLEEQALAPIENPDEMALPLDSALERLRRSNYYNELFRQVYQAAPNRENLAAAIAAFERTLETTESPFDNWKFSGDSNLVSASVRRGFELFSTKGKCTQCHFGSDFTANEFRNIGLYNGVDFNDSGRAVISGRLEDLGKFKTPGLRNVGITAPYMHNGAFHKLIDVVNFYNEGGGAGLGLDVPNQTLPGNKLNLTEQEKNDIIAFLESLTDSSYDASVPTTLPSFTNNTQLNNRKIGGKY
ncbi:MAG: c-type cytochrome [Sphingobacteriales bacterium]|nr:MAG: c-type cytochrome [Sphingobacteriales bacterium]